MYFLCLQYIRAVVFDGDGDDDDNGEQDSEGRKSVSADAMAEG